MNKNITIEDAKLNLQVIRSFAISPSLEKTDLKSLVGLVLELRKTADIIENKMIELDRKNRYDQNSGGLVS